MPGLILVNSVHVNRPAINPFVETKGRGLGAVADDGFKGSRIKTVDRIDRKHLIRVHLREGGDDCKDEKKNKNDLTAMFHRLRGQRVCPRCLWLILLITDSSRTERTEWLRIRHVVSHCV